MNLSKEQINAVNEAAEEVGTFVTGTLEWHRRRGSPEAREAAKRMAKLIPKLAAEVSNEMQDALQHAPAA